MAELRLVDQYGNPIKRGQLTKEVAAPSLAGVRQAWNSDAVASGLTPYRLASLLQSAAEGDADDFLTLAEEMEEREPHYSSVLGTRKRAISGLEVTVEAASDETKDVKLADAIRELIRAPEFGDMVDDLLDGLGKGYAVVEILWDRSAAVWTPRYERRDQRWFVFSKENAYQLMLRDESDPAGKPLPGYQFMIHTPRLKSGIPIRGGLARLAAASYMCKAYTIKDWMAFAEVFGMPIRVGKHGPNATPDEIGTLVSAVANIGTDAAAVIPDSMQLEFVEAGKSTGGQELFLKLAEWLDRQVSKAVLGQVASTEGTPGKLGNDDAQDEVRKDILRADAKQVANTLNRDLVKPYIDLNLGVQQAYPRIQLLVTEPEDIAALVDALDKLVPKGLRVGQSVIRDKLGLPDPEEGAELLGVSTPTDTGDEPPPAQNRATATNRADPDVPDTLDEIEAEMLEGWEVQMEPVLDPLHALVEECGDYEELLARLPELLGEGGMDSTALLEKLAEATFKARGLGDGTDHP